MQARHKQVGTYSSGTPSKIGTEPTTVCYSKGRGVQNGKGRFILGDTILQMIYTNDPVEMWMQFDQWRIAMVAKEL